MLRNARRAGRSRSGEAGGEEIKELRKERNKAARQLREKQKAQGLKMPLKSAIPNRKSEYRNVEEEQEARQEATTEQVKVFQSYPCC